MTDISKEAVDAALDKLCDISGQYMQPETMEQIIVAALPMVLAPLENVVDRIRFECRCHGCNLCRYCEWANKIEAIYASGGKGE